MKKWLAAASVLSLSVLLTACSVADDEAWLRITAFYDDEAETNISVFESELRDGMSDTIDVKVQNSSVFAGSGATEGTSIHVYRAKVEYAYSNVTIPSFDYAVTLTVGPKVSTASTGDGTTTSGGEGTLEDLPLVPLSLKNWILNSGRLPDGVVESSFRITAKVTLRSRTDEGTELKTSASLGITFE